MELPKWSNYGDYKSENYGAHTLRFDIGGYTFWYSYRTLVAFRAPGHPLVVHTNVWTKTTAKHLTMIDGGRPDERVDSETFARLLKELVSPCFQVVPS